MTIKNPLVLVGILALAGAFIWVIYRGPLWNRGQAENTPPSIVGDVPKEATISNLPAIEYGYVTGTSTSEKEQLRADMPSLNRPVIMPSSFSAEAANVAKKDMEVLIALLKANPSNGAYWKDLGMARKGIEDYEGAKEAYEYAHKLFPKDSVIADNLGVIYGDYLKIYPKAEEYYRVALTLDPKTPYRYLRLFEFYRYLLKDPAKAKAILEEGLRAIPGEASFTTLLETL